MTGPRSLPRLHSVGVASDIAALGPEAVVEIHADRLVVRRPDLPEYWSGNFVLFRTSEVDPAAQVARFRADFPGADHVAIGWDDPAAAFGPGHAALSTLGFDIDLEDVLLADGAAAPVAAPEGIVLRALTGDADWAAATDLQIETDLEEGYEGDPHRVFVTRRTASWRRHGAAGGLRWFGAFDGERLVGDLGVVVAPGLARFQAVETRASHRRRGIAAALVAHASAWADRAVPGGRQVILADAGSAAGRVYRRLGFTREERIATATRGSYGRM